MHKLGYRKLIYADKLHSDHYSAVDRWQGIQEIASKKGFKYRPHNFSASRALSRNPMYAQD